MIHVTYLTDSGAFKASKFVQHLRNHNKNNAHHQNGKAKHTIRTLPNMTLICIIFYPVQIISHLVIYSLVHKTCIINFIMCMYGAIQCMSLIQHYNQAIKYQDGNHLQNGYFFVDLLMMEYWHAGVRTQGGEGKIRKFP